MGYWDEVGGKYEGGTTGGIGGKLVGGAKSAWGSYKEGLNRDKAGALGKLGGQAEAASGFAGGAERAFGTLGSEATQERDYMRRIARGDESVSAMQLQQALQQNQAQQQSMAAGARPGNAAMAARTAAMTAGRQGAGLAGQQAMAGIQERQSAQNALQQMLMQQRQQELQATLGGRGQAIQGYGTQFTGQMGQPTGMEQGLGLAKTAGQMYAMSDERIKHNIEDGTKDADSALRKLKAFKYDYDNDKHGKGKQLGVMAQDLERIGLGHAVTNTPEGKAVHGPKVTLAITAMLAAVNKRLETIEGK